ncbi:MAG: aminoacyl-tRNA hydrolase [Abitibacteriaceae bacterium]|nr:aminoacyl-tRNA hydrolase [Abditibacteriaceae bacterium]
MIQITPKINIEETELEFSFVRASGPGGQHVNKVSSVAVLRFDIPHSTLPDDVKQRLISLAGKRVTDQGTLIIKGQEFRTQERNRQVVIERLIELIRQAATPPKVRIPTKPPRAAQEKRLKAKRRQSEVKKVRRTTSDFNE